MSFSRRKVVRKPTNDFSVYVRTYECINNMKMLHIYLLLWSNSCSGCTYIQPLKAFILEKQKQNSSGLLPSCSLFWSGVVEVMCVTAATWLCRFSSESVWTCWSSETLRGDKAQLMKKFLLHLTDWTCFFIPLLFRIWIFLKSVHVSVETRGDGSNSEGISADEILILTHFMFDIWA